MRKFIRNTRGTVSIFLISIIAIIFFFNAVLIDYARIQASKRQTDAAVQAAVRSVLAAFDQELQGKYGLFGVKESEVKELFEQIIEENLNKPEDGGFQLITPELLRGSAQMQTTGDLGKHVILQQQILEDMKYKAPIEITLNMLDKFKPLAKVLKTASAATKSAKKMKKHYTKREKKLEDFWKERQGLLGKSSSLLTDISKIRQAGGQYSTIHSQYIDTQSMDYERDRLDGTRSSKQTERSSLESERSARIASAQPGQSVDTSSLDRQIELLSGQISYLDQKISELDAKISRNLAVINPYLSGLHQTMNHALKTVKDMEKSYATMKEAIESAKQSNQEMKAAWEKAKQDTQQQNYEKVSNAPETEGTTSTDPQLGAVEEQLDKVVKELEALILPDSYFERIERELAAEQRQLMETKAGISQLQSMMPTVYHRTTNLPGVSPVQGLTGGTHAKHEAVNGEIVQHGNPNNYPEEEKRRKDNEVYQARTKQSQQQDGSDGSAPSLEKQGEFGMKDMFTIIKMVKGIETAREDYVKLDGFYQSYLASGGVGGGKSGESNIPITDDMEDSAESAMGAMDKLFEGLSNFLMTMRNELYVNEYAVQRFNSFKPNFGPILASPKPDMDKIAAEFTKMMSVKGSELEYIVYGLDTPGGNISAAYGELFLFRLALRTLEGFMDREVRALGHPILVMIAAIAYGVVKAVKDIGLFLQGKNVEIIGLPILKEILLDYKDYLRLFLLLHSNEEKKLSRMQALIQFNTKKDLREHLTYVKGNAEFSLRLWFLPGIMRAMNTTVQMNGRVEGNRYIYTHGDRAMSY
ncbi:hypothetical protein BBG47_19970 [Paenibacillus sp. KS1]|uniref:hypothetical protein n=1 Tax=Paenibacillus sp. KS1 TaxID=1849249 RepID=UPI0008064713|nr:hypothetical protein [Paenibacillus sp. KS1]OBY77769.1 hypothetical protein BBG47_19970 [Paenibacillus sp. KS1]